MKHSASLAERFWPKVDVRGSDECWEWRSKKCKGYGVLKVRGHLLAAHRLAWTLVNGPIPEGLCVCHHCDNPACVNPAHLFSGTKADNNQDRDAKGRARYNPAWGEQHRRARLTREDVREIRRLGTIGDNSCGRLAERFGISHSHVCNIVARRVWAWLDQKKEWLL